MRKLFVIQYSDALGIAEACQAKAAELNIGVSVAVLDGSGHSVLCARFDGAPFQTPDVAKGKALTAVMMRRSSKTIEDATLARPTMTTFNDGRIPIQGGLPLFVDQQCVGSVGISGETPDQDELIAQSGVECFTHSVQAS